MTKENKKITVRSIIAYLIFAVVLVAAPFYLAYNAGSSIFWSIVFVPVSWLASGAGAYIAIWCMKQIDKK